MHIAKFLFQKNKILAILTNLFFKIGLVYRYISL